MYEIGPPSFPQQPAVAGKCLCGNWQKRWELEERHRWSRQVSIFEYLGSLSELKKFELFCRPSNAHYCSFRCQQHVGQMSHEKDLGWPQVLKLPVLSKEGSWVVIG